jgi:hypothetical protein
LASTCSNPHKRRLVLLLEGNGRDDAEPLVVAGDDLLARLGSNEVQRVR